MNHPSWGDFAAASPELAVATRERLHRRISYLATVRKDGSPRVYPVTPIVAEHDLYLFMEPTSPKGHDLRRDTRFALHAGVEDNEGGGGELAIKGRARSVGDAAERAVAVAASPYPPAERYVLFALSLSEVVLTRYGEAGPIRKRWEAGQDP